MKRRRRSASPLPADLGRSLGVALLAATFACSGGSEETRGSASGTGVQLADLEVKRKRSLSDIKSTTDKKLEVRSAVCLLDPPKTARVLLQSKDGKGALAFEHAVGEGRMLVLAHANLLTNRYLATDDVVVVLRRFVAKHAVVGDTIAFLEAARAGQMWRAMQRAGMAGSSARSSARRQLGKREKRHYGWGSSTGPMQPRRKL